MKISREGLIVIFFGILAVIAFIRSGIQLTLLPGLILLFIPVLTLVWAYFAVRSIEIRRELPDEGVAGEQLFTTYSLSTNSLLPAFGVRFTDIATRGYISGLNLKVSSGVTLRESFSVMGRFLNYMGVILLEEVDLFEEAFHKAGLKADFPTSFPPVMRGHWMNKTLPLTFPVRGKYRVGPGEIEAGDPLGIFKVKIKTHGFSEVLILPTWTSLRFFPSGGSSRILRDENIQQNREGSSPEFLGIREYREGDPLKSVHWKLTAKHKQLMVKQFVQQVESSWGVILDLRKGFNAGKGRETSLEYMVEIVAAVLENFDDEKVPHVLVLAADDVSTTECLRGERMFNDELKLLAASRNDGTLTLHERTIRLTDKYPHMSWVLVTARKDEDIIQSVQTLSRFGGNVLVAMIEMNSFLTGDFPPEMISKWRRIWGDEMEDFNSALLATGAKLHMIKRGDDLGLTFFS